MDVVLALAEFRCRTKAPHGDRSRARRSASKLRRSAEAQILRDGAGGGDAALPSGMGHGTAGTAAVPTRPLLTAGSHDRSDLAVRHASRPPILHGSVALRS